MVSIGLKDPVGKVGLTPICCVANRMRSQGTTFEAPCERIQFVGVAVIE